MAVGDRIKRARNLRGMTQKELGIAIGFEEKSADIRIAQYESNTRTPKEELLRKIAEVLDVNYRSLYEPTLYAAEDVMYTLFELDEHYPGTRLYEVTDTTDPDLPEKHMAVSFRYRLLDDFLKEWQSIWNGSSTGPRPPTAAAGTSRRKSGVKNKRHKNAL